MFIVIKKKTVISVIAVILVITVGAFIGYYFINSSKTASIGQKIIVIDAGHGGCDKGVVGASGTEEAAKNLEIAELLKARLEDRGFFVVMTRTTDEGADPTGGFKQEDFERRKLAIEKVSPDMVVSVHCNKFPSCDRRGAQVFYNPLSEKGKLLAGIMQESLNGLNVEKVGRTFSALGGEYYMLNLSDAPAVIVECGFLSNPEDEKLLCDKEYLDDLVHAICDGIVGFYLE